MIDYELAAYQSVEKMRKEHVQEIRYLQSDFASSPRRYKKSKKVVDFRVSEQKTFKVKDYNGATYYKHIADQLEQKERQEHEEKLNSLFNREEQRLRKMQSTQINNLLQRIQRDRDEQLLHRQQDS